VGQTTAERPVVGVLALQGDVAEHCAALERAGANAFEVRTPDDLARAEALIIPGGESTTVVKLLERFGLAAPIKERVRGGMPLWGTCMGMIVAAHDVADLNQPTLDLLDITVRRNSFGRQIASAEVDLAIPALGLRPFPAVFIRAPWIERAGEGVDVGEGVRIALPAELRNSAPEAITVGVRPEHLVPGGGEETFRFKVETVEALGADSLVHGAFGTGMLVARVEGHATPAPGELMRFSAMPGRLYFFDTVSGKRLRP